MPIPELMRIQQNADFETKTSLAVAMNCAPVLKGSKAANIMTVTLAEFNMIKKLVAGTGISYYLLRGKNDKFIIFLYRREKLESYLAQPEVKEFLAEYGYNSDNFYAMLCRLSIHAKQFANGEDEFPHEIGAFLEYPIDDIRGFMANKGENSRLTGYWKVYRNVKKTAALFKRFDHERDLSVQEIMGGKTIREIAV